MGMPEFPKREHPPRVCDVVLSILESVAVEELAIAHILNAEGEKLQEIVKKYSYDDICVEQIDKMCKNTYSMINSLVIKEWILLNKVHSALEIYETIGSNDECDEDDCVHRKERYCDKRGASEHRI